MIITPEHIWITFTWYPNLPSSSSSSSSALLCYSREWTDMPAKVHKDTLEVGMHLFSWSLVSFADFLAAVRWICKKQNKTKTTTQPSSSSFCPRQRRFRGKSRLPHTRMARQDCDTRGGEKNRLVCQSALCKMPHYAQNGSKQRHITVQHHHFAPPPPHTHTYQGT